MARRIFKRPQAIRDIEDCFVYIATENLDAGLRFLTAIETDLMRLAEFPELGTKRKFRDRRFQHIRMWRVEKYESYLIFYEITEDQIELVRVLYVARNIKNLFD